MTHLGDLNRELQQKLEQERKQIQELHNSELTKLKQNLETECQNVLNTFSTATQVIKEKSQNQLKWYLLLPGATIISLLIGSCLGNWAMTQYLAHQVNQITSQQAENQRQQKTLELLKKKTWGIELYQNNNGKFIIIPPNSPLSQQTQWKCNNKPCLKL
jgi:uncharacterized membrane-anchored protein YhcB (DUF1043 family)